MMPEESQNHRRWDKSSNPTAKVLQNVSCIHTAFIDTSTHQHILETSFWIVLYPNSVPGNTEVEEVDPSHTHTKRSCCMHLGTLHPQLTVALSPYACWLHSPVDSFECLKQSCFQKRVSGFFSPNTDILGHGGQSKSTMSWITMLATLLLLRRTA